MTTPKTTTHNDGLPPGSSADRLDRRPPLSITNRWRAFIELPAAPRADLWQPFMWDNEGTPQHGLWLIAERAPWHKLFAALDHLGRDLADGPVPIEDEADAIVACCWRYGSYFDLLTGGELFPPFRTDTELSRLSDWEMKRINLEYSSGLATWLADREGDPARIWRRVRSAIAHLPLPWRDVRECWWMDSVRFSAQQRTEKLESKFSAARGLGALSQFQAVVPASDPQHHLRQEANYAVNASYRNGQIENFHAGASSHGKQVPGFLRFYSRDVTRLADDASAKMAMHLIEREQQDPEVLRIMHAAGSPSHWSLIKETSPVRFYGMPSAGPMEDRIRQLAERFPLRFEARLDGEVPLAEQQLEEFS